MIFGALALPLTSTCAAMSPATISATMSSVGSSVVGAVERDSAARDLEGLAEEIERATHHFERPENLRRLAGPGYASLPRHSLSRPRPRTKICPGKRDLDVERGGQCGRDRLGGSSRAVVAVRGGARLGRASGARLLISTTCNLVTLGGRLSGMPRSPCSVVNCAVTLGEATEPAMATLPVAGQHRIVSSEDTEIVQRRGQVGGRRGARQQRRCRAR